MKTLALANGDLVVGQTGHTTVSGAPKIQQEVALALGEPYGDDRFHPTWGSVLVEYVGVPITDEIEMLVQSEVARVIAQYIAIQQREVLKDHLALRQSRFDASDVVTGIGDLTATVNLDTILIKGALTTQAGSQVQIQRTVTIA